MKLICEVKIGGVDTVKVITTASNANHAQFLKNQPGVGKPFLLFETLPSGTPTGVDFSMAPIVSSEVSANSLEIAELIANPPFDALTY